MRPKNRAKKDPKAARGESRHGVTNQERNMSPNPVRPRKPSRGHTAGKVDPARRSSGAEGRLTTDCEATRLSGDARGINRNCIHSKCLLIMLYLLFKPPLGEIPLYRHAA